MAQEIGVEEWLEELRKLGVTDGGSDALTVREIGRLVGHADEWVRHRLQLAMQQGLIAVAKKALQTIDGRTVMVPAYRLKTGRPSPKKRKQS